MISRHFQSIIQCFHNASPPDSPIMFEAAHESSSSASSSNAFHLSRPSCKDDDSTSLSSLCNEPIHILNVAIATDRGIDDETLTNQFLEFVRNNKVCVNRSMSFFCFCIIKPLFRWTTRPLA